MPASDAHTKASILIASGNSTLTTQYTEILAAAFSTAIIDQVTATCDGIAETHPHLVILDPSLFSDLLPETIGKILKRTPHTRIIVLKGTTATPVDEMLLFKTGAHGFCDVEIQPDLLIKAAQAVCHGEIWVPKAINNRTNQRTRP